MAVRRVELAEIGEVAIYKRRGVKGVKLSIAHDGQVRVTLPMWAPYRLGVEFALDRSQWILSQRQPKVLIRSGDRVGKAHRFVFLHKETKQPRSRIKGTDIIVVFSPHLAFNDAIVQAVAEKAAIRALKKEAEQLLPQRLDSLAQKLGFSYNSVRVKKLKSRWGSCNERSDITLNIFLMQLPWHLIDYVILHELTHTKVLRHGPPFWSEMSKYSSSVKELRKEIKSHQTMLVMSQPT